MPEKTKVSAESKRNRVFSYRCGEVSFTVTLRTDVKNEMQDFLKILETAKSEVEQELANAK